MSQQQRQPYPFEVYNRPGCLTINVPNDQCIFIELTETLTIIQYPRCWDYDQCCQWATENQYPEPEHFVNFNEGVLTFAQGEGWFGNIMGIPRQNH